MTIHLITIGALINLLLLSVPEIATEFPIGPNLLEFMLATAVFAFAFNMLGVPADIFHFVVSNAAKNGDTEYYARQKWA